ncbi:hypothetical protein PBI_TOAKA_42 [Mycobacterium phage Toaka]|nr:hypothetical protein PBI_TOAKA_42 [Mycobacterium phage Toaka]
MIPDWPQWGLNASNSDPESFETGTVLLTLSSRISMQELVEVAGDDPAIAALLEGLE